VCNKSGEEFYLNIWNKLPQVNEINATLTTHANTSKDAAAYLDSYCGADSKKDCGN
jgi:hypothetical protein